jgi:hypothetical protein
MTFTFSAKALIINGEEYRPKNNVKDTRKAVGDYIKAILGM